MRPIQNCIRHNFSSIFDKKTQVMCITDSKTYEHFRKTLKIYLDESRETVFQRNQ